MNGLALIDQARKCLRFVRSCRLAPLYAIVGDPIWRWLGWVK